MSGPPSTKISEGPARGPSATPSGGEIADALGEARVLAADRLGDARPAVLRGPALALAAQPPAQGAVAEHARDTRGQGAGIALGDQQPRHAVAHRALQTAHPGGNDGAAAGHRLQRHHPERLVVRGQHRDVGGDVPVAQALLRLRADEADGVAEAERGGAAAATMRRSSAMRRAGSRSAATPAPFLRAPSVWNICTSGTPQRARSASPTTPESQ